MAGCSPLLVVRCSAVSLHEAEQVALCRQDHRGVRGLRSGRGLVCQQIRKCHAPKRKRTDPHELAARHRSGAQQRTHRQAIVLSWFIRNPPNVGRSCRSINRISNRLPGPVPSRVNLSIDDRPEIGRAILLDRETVFVCCCGPGWTNSARAIVPHRRCRWLKMNRRRDVPLHRATSTGFHP